MQYRAVITATKILVQTRPTISPIAPKDPVFSEIRPATLRDADIALAAHGFGRVGEWDLAPEGMAVSVEPIHNRFNETRAARLWEAEGTTHRPGTTAPVDTVNPGDLIGEVDDGPWYVVAGISEIFAYDDTLRVHMVAEGGTWDDRVTTEFSPHRMVSVARKR